MLTGSQIRAQFLKFFEQRGHRVVHSSSLIPPDETLLFTNAGMNQFKDVFLGADQRDYNRAATSQKCVRAGGKHNDLENVGFTNRHHTFFEMLGNFSFGDYFKKDAIAYAWELITSEKWYGVDKSKLYCTIFEGSEGVPRDTDAEKFWHEVGVPKERIFAMGMKDNFWQMGDTGPCGPCSEMHYDSGVEASDKKHPDCAAGKCQFPCPNDCGRYMEIWNLVFMQFDRDASGKLMPLPKPSIDTGMGLERIAAVLQGKVSNYDTDLFTPLIKKAAELTGVDAKKELEAENKKISAASLRVIADHARCVTFLISDGVLPANEGRGYVLRKILRRAIRHGRILGEERPFLHMLVPEVVRMMTSGLQGSPYPELLETAERVERAVYEEERRFASTLDIGLKKLFVDLSPLMTEKLVASYGGTLDQMKQMFGDTVTWEDWGTMEPRRIPIYKGEKAFKLYDTFGLPLDFIEDACRDQGIALDTQGFDEAMTRQRELARASWKGGAKQSAAPVYRELDKTKFEGYAQTESRDCEVLAIVKDGQGAKDLKPGEKGELVLDHTPFYADSGGQVGDIGVFRDSSGNVVAEVNGCVMPVAGVRAHKVVAKQPIHVGQKVDAVVHADVRLATVRNHTGTHLIHAALRETLGKHVKQAGSLVDPKHLRFDFSHFTGVADEELQDIEDLVNKEVLKNTKVDVINDVPIDVAINEYKAMALFGEKYGDKVRVIKIGDFSTELCGGIHTAATGEIGLVKLLHESSVSSGVRRVEAITGEDSVRHFRTDHRIVSVTGQLLGQPNEDAEAFRLALQTKDDEIKRLRKELEQARMKSASASVSTAADQVKEVKGIKVLAQRVDNVDRNQMRVLVDNLRNKLGSGVVVLGSVSEVEGEKKVAIVVGVTKDLTSRIQAGKIVGLVAKKVGGSGGGRPDMAEAGGKDPSALDAALASSPEVVASLLA